jgi:hypothetical protein
VTYRLLPIRPNLARPALPEPNTPYQHRRSSPCLPIHTIPDSTDHSLTSLACRALLDRNFPQSPYLACQTGTQPNSPNPDLPAAPNLNPPLKPIRALPAKPSQHSAETHLTPPAGTLQSSIVAPSVRYRPDLACQPYHPSPCTAGPNLPYHN